MSQAFALAVLLVSGEAPWDFPVRALMSVNVLAALQRRRHEGNCGRRRIIYHSRPPDSGFVRRKGPNIADCVGVRCWTRVELTMLCSEKTPADFLGGDT